MEALQAVQLVQGIQKASWVPPDLHGETTFFSATDSWQYVRSDHPRMCEECDSYHLSVYTGDTLRSTFPYLQIIDTNFIYPKVHMHCFCGLVRLYSAEDVTRGVLPLPTQGPSEPLEINVKVQMVAPMHNTALSPEAEMRLMQLPDRDFDSALNSMVLIGYITHELMEQIKRKRKEKKQVESKS